MENEQHYAILYVDEKRTQYTIFESTDLDSLAQIYARILQFESMFRTFPNESCHVVLEQDFNYDPDTGAWNMANIVSPKWELFVEEIKRDFPGRIGDIIDPCHKD